MADYGVTTNNATFSVVATGTGSVRYQWRKNGVNILNATQPILNIQNVTLADDGRYDVQVTDDIATLTTSAARLTVLITPVYLVPPATNVTVAVNGSFSASVVIRGNPPPFRYEWREISTARATNIVNDTTNFFTSGPITNLVAKQWRLVIFNDASLSGERANFSGTLTSTGMASVTTRSGLRAPTRPKPTAPCESTSPPRRDSPSSAWV